MRRAVVTLTVLLGVLMTTALSSSAARTTAFGRFGPVAGTSTDYTTTMQLPADGFPQATVTSDSRADVAVPTGATNWFGANSPPGLRYGSSRDQAYVNLRPRADNASSPSTTTYTFDRPTPQGWTFVLGDIDADEVQVSATRADGAPATTAELGFRSAFNLCDTSPSPSSVCAANGRPKDVPTWTAATATLRGNAAAVDSDGATGWFEPTTSLRTLTFTFTRRAGFPVFQTWFAVVRQQVSGPITTTAGTCDLSAATVSLLDAEGSVVDTRSAAGGSYVFAGVAASDGYRVALSGVPATCVATSATSVPIDLRTGDVTQGFTVRQAVPVPITGRVTSGGTALEGVTLTLTPTLGGPSRTAVTDVDGRYVFEDNPDDADYSIAVTPPAGYLGVPARTATVPPGATAPVTGQDFVLPALPTVSGTVTGPDGPVAGVTVELVGSTSTYRAVTRADGTYALPRVPAGSYSLAVPTPPAGYQAPPAVPVTVGTVDLPGRDVALLRAAATGSVAGTVTLDGAPLAGAAVTVRPTSGTATSVTTDTEGTFGVGGLAPGTYQIAVAGPAGTTGTTTRTAVITAAGDDLLGQDFAFTTVPPTPSPTAPAPSPPAPGESDPDDPSGDDPSPGAGAEPAEDAVLPDSGGPPRSLPLLGLVLLAGGVAVVVGARPRRS